MANERPRFWLVDDEWSDDHSLEIDLFKKHYPDCEILYTRDHYEEDFQNYGKDADAVALQISYPLPAEMVKQFTKCRGIAVFGSGYDNLDVAALKEAGIPSCNVNGYCAEDLADHVLACVLDRNKRIQDMNAGFKKGEWGAEAIHCTIHRLSNQKFLLMGCGWIGSVVGKKCAAIGLDVMVYDPYLPDEKVREMGFRPVGLEEGLATADYVSLHIRLFEETIGFMDMEKFKMMKPGATLINVARGAIVNEADMIQALKDGTLAYAMTDVVCNEPPKADNPIFDCPNLFVTPHTSYASVESTIELRTRTVENAIALYEGRETKDLIRY